jgi:transposase-like protein
MEKTKHHHHHSAKEREQAFTYLKQGMTIKETAMLCGVSMSTIKNWSRTKALRGKSYLNKGKSPYNKYSDELKIAAVKQYLNGRDATEVAILLGILNPTSITAWAKDERFRGGMSMQQEKRPKKNLERRRAIKPIEEMTQEEELAFLRMENAILKKAISLKKKRQQEKKK